MQRSIMKPRSDPPRSYILVSEPLIGATSDNQLGPNLTTTSFQNQTPPQIQDQEQLRQRQEEINTRTLRSLELTTQRLEQSHMNLKRLNAKFKGIHILPIT